VLTGESREFQFHPSLQVPITGTRPKDTYRVQVVILQRSLESPYNMEHERVGKEHQILEADSESKKNTLVSKK
jgi:hypothetical protein